jgi:integral membrane sensor domain MASE1
MFRCNSHDVRVPVAGRRPTDRTTWLVVAGYVVLAAAPFVLAATHAWFWKHEHSTAPAAAAVVAALLAALVLGQRWAWLLLTVFQAAVLISFAFDFTNVPALLLNLGGFALLASPQMRRHVRQG